MSKNVDHNKTLVDFLLKDNPQIDHEKYMQIKEETGKYLVTPLKVIALMVAISGIFAMIFEVRHHAEYSFQIYFVRLLATLIAFIILIFLSSKNATKYSIHPCSYFAVNNHQFICNNDTS